MKQTEEIPGGSKHRFLDEAGDSTFYGKGKIPIIGTEGVSHVFILGMVTFNVPLASIRQDIIRLQEKIANSPYYRKVPSVQKRVDKGGYYFHAKDDLPEIRKEFFDYIHTLDCRFEAVVGRKDVQLFERKHNGKEAEFYADLLSHLLQDNLNKYSRLVMNIAKRSNSTAIQNLEKGLQKAEERFRKINPKENSSTKIVFSVHKFKDEPLLTVADYFCWSIQRVFEKGEVRFYDYMAEKISLVLDLYDTGTQSGGGNYYTITNPLTEKNKVSPQTL